MHFRILIIFHKHRFASDVFSCFIPLVEFNYFSTQVLEYILGILINEDISSVFIQVIIVEKFNLYFSLFYSINLGDSELILSQKCCLLKLANWENHYGFIGLKVCNFKFLILGYDVTIFYFVNSEFYSYLESRRCSYGISDYQ